MLRLLRLRPGPGRRPPPVVVDAASPHRDNNGDDDDDDATRLRIDSTVMYDPTVHPIPPPATPATAGRWTVAPTHPPPEADTAVAPMSSPMPRMPLLLLPRMLSMPRILPPLWMPPVDWAVLEKADASRRADTVVFLLPGNQVLLLLPLQPPPLVDVTLNDGWTSGDVGTMSRTSPNHDGNDCETDRNENVEGQQSDGGGGGGDVGGSPAGGGGGGVGRVRPGDEDDGVLKADTNDVVVPAAASTPTADAAGPTGGAAVEAAADASSATRI